ncbi:MAG TPA: M23 family metallopeptidase [Spirochaetales bacterium]|nr:M23 family metallopeptidase [Spirochaetales bacterium]HPD80248.1 M23 family metallopeptidase [Spirochaetales bacterium]HQK34220.1 M23 family metallopeptidase [Spirochaetales bacterium]HRV28616.1 M23 family metallopeptidase [Spirochaetia bacterium]
MRKYSDVLLQYITQKFPIIIIASVLCFSVMLPGSAIITDNQLAMGSVSLSELPPEAGISETDEDLSLSGDLYYFTYIVKKGDTISQIASNFNVYPDAIITLNNLKSTRFISVGTVLKIPSINGITYTVTAGDTLDKIAAAYNISAERIQEVNMASGTIQGDLIAAGKVIFLPDARLPSWTLKEINGDLFLWPIRGYITSWYGWRRDPITNARSFHTGLDIGAPLGTPVRAAMDGTVIAVNFSTGMGNYIIIKHRSGYKTLYAHLKSAVVSVGDYVTTSNVIGYVGNTGYSTGPHLHFTVYKNGYTINPMAVLK